MDAHSDINIRPAQRGAVAAMLALLAATFVVSVGFGMNVPILPALISSVGEVASGGLALHAGLLAAMFTLAMGAAAPAWGAWSDRVGRRLVLLIGLAGFAVSAAALSIPTGLLALYALQLLSGVFAGAVLPVASAAVADVAPSEQWRASRIAWLNMSVVAGFVLGPIAAARADALVVTQTGQVLAPPFLGLALAAVAALAGVVFGLSQACRPPAAALAATARRRIAALIGLTVAVAFAVGVFEVGIAVRGIAMGLSAAEVAALFVSCSLLMFGAQATLFGPPDAPRRSAQLLAPCLITLAAGLALSGLARGFGTYLFGVALFAASAGILVPSLAYWVSRSAGEAQGAQLGRQLRAMGVGQALGSATAGLMLQVLDMDGVSLLVAAGLAAVSSLPARSFSRQILSSPLQPQRPSRRRWRQPSR